MSQEIMLGSAGVQYPMLMRTSYGSQYVNAIGGDNSMGMNSSVSNFGNDNGKCCEMNAGVEADASNLSAVYTTISSIDSKIAGSFK